jgi:transposase
MIKQRQVEHLDPWLADAQASTIAHLKSFADGLLRDYDAVRAALTLEWSNGQLEGQVNRLKVLKRMMYGRANFDLLRLRVLYPP